MADTTMDEKIAALEVALAHAEKQIGDLSDLAETQWKEIKRLNARLSRTQSQLEDHIATISDQREREAMTVSEMAARDKPPHY
ncbi:MAG: SlyX family protein [Pseudobdellovibrionaceae bacterium]